MTGKRHDDPPLLDPTPLRDNDRSSVELTWGRRSLRVHGLIAVVALFAMLAVVGVPLYSAWYASPPESVPTRTRLAAEHQAIIDATRERSDELLYVLMLPEKERSDLRKRLAVPRRFRTPEDHP